MGRQFSKLRCMDGGMDEPRVPTQQGAACPSCLTQTCLSFKSTDSYKPNGTTEHGSKITNIKSKPPSSSARVSNGSISFDRLSASQQQLARTRSSKKQRKTASSSSSLSSCCCQTAAAPASHQQRHEAGELNKNDDNLRCRQLQTTDDSPRSGFLLNPSAVAAATTNNKHTTTDESSQSSETNSQTNLVNTPPPFTSPQCDESSSSQQRTSPPPQPLVDDCQQQEEVVKSMNELNIEHPNEVATDDGSEQQDTTVVEKKDDDDDVEVSSSSKLICRFRELVKYETTVLNELIEKWKVELKIAEENDCPTEACDDIRAVIGKTGLIIAQRFTQFLRLVDQANGGEPSGKINTDRPVFESDLDGFWEMDYIQVKKAKDSFSLLEERKKNGWEVVVVVTPSTTTQTKKKRRVPKKNEAPSPEAIARREAAALERKTRMKKMREMKRQQMQMKQQQNDGDDQLTVSFTTTDQPTAAQVNEDEGVVDSCKVDSCIADKHIFNHLKGDGDHVVTINTTSGLHPTLVG